MLKSIPNSYKASAEELLLRRSAWGAEFSRLTELIRGQEYDVETNRRRFPTSDDDYSFIPTPCGTMMKSIHYGQCLYLDLCDPPHRITFYDIGSGYGNVLYMAQQLLANCIVIGIDKYDRRNAFHLVRPAYIKDLIDLTKEEISSPGIIYLYNPIVNKDKMRKGLTHLVAIAPSHSIIVFVNVAAHNAETLPVDRDYDVYIEGNVKVGNDLGTQYIHIK